MSNGSDRLQQLAEAGVSIWLDDLSRERIETGNLADLIKHRSVVGVTTNPSIFQAALADGERVHASWRVFAARTAGAAAGLGDGFGLSPGDRVAIVMRNRPEYLEALFAIWHAGLVAVPVNARLHRDEIAYILEHSGSSVVVTDADSFASVVRALRERAERVDASGPAPGRVP